MSEVCEILKLYQESGHVEKALLLDAKSGEGYTAYGIRMKRQGRKPGPLLFLSYCPGCGTPQNIAGERGPLGLFCTMAGVPLKQEGG